MKSISILDLKEFENSDISYYKKDIVQSLKSPYCSKVEVYEDSSVFIRLKAERKDINTNPLFVIGILEQSETITIIRVSGDLSLIESIVQTQSFSSISDLFFSILFSLIKNDSEFLSLIESEAEKTEEKILEGVDANFFPLLTKRKRIVSKFEAFYLDMLSILDDLEEADKKTKNTLEQKISRLQVYANRICQNISEIRSEGESLQIEKENKTMQFLTVVTTIFLPLSLLTSWYGMNWKNMKELDWKWGYLIFIVVAVLIVMLEFVFFITHGYFDKKKRKKKDK